MDHLNVLDSLEADVDRKLVESGGSLDNLNVIERMTVVRRAFQWEVNNGGLYAFLWNSSGDHAKEAVSVLRLIGATEAATILEQANALFGQDGPSQDVLVRRQQMDTFNDEQRTRIDELTSRYFRLEDAGLSTAELLVSYVMATGRGSAS